MNARPAASGTTIGYREEIFHPAVTTPVVARGWFEYADDGALIRHQTEPQAETVTIDQRYIYRRRETSGFSSTVSIPSDIAPLLNVLRAVVAGNREELAELSKDHATNIDSSDAGWALTLTTDQQDSTPIRMVLGGCGDLLRSVELQLPDGARRRYIFEGAP